MPKASPKPRVALSLTPDEWTCVREAAADCHMEPVDYCRLMVLCAAGMGGAIEHLERASRASLDADARPSVTVRIERAAKRKGRAGS